jgi:hypothetical protein
MIGVHTAEPLVPGPSRLEFEIAIAKLKMYKSPGSDEIPATLIQAGGEILLSAIHKLINSVWNEEELPNKWKESIIIPLHKKNDKIRCTNYRGISLLSTSYKMLSIILPSRLSPYIGEIIGDHQCGFRRNRPTTDQIFCISQILEKKWEYNETVHQLQEEIKRRLNSGNACYHSVQNLLSSHLLSKNLKIRIYKTIILPVVLYGCETWSLTLKEENRLRVFENRVLRRIFGPKRDEVTGEWRKLPNKELHDLYY